MNYAIKRVYIKSNWFDGNNNKYKKIGYQGFNLYLNLFKFRIYNQDHPYTFITSISFLRKETGYPTQKVYELLRLLDKNKIIHTNITRWERMFDTEGKLIDDKVLFITGIDKPNTKKDMDEKGNMRDFPVTDDDYYISLDLPLMDYYIGVGLNEKYFALHCLFKKMSNNTEAKAWMSINKMAKVLGIGDKNINQMIYDLNKHYLLASYYRSSSKKRVVKGEKVSGKSFEHHILYNLDLLEEWIKVNKVHIDKNVAKWEKKMKSKGIDFLESDESVDDIPVEVYELKDEWDME